MATVLQRQLATIAAKSTHQLDLKAQKAAHGKSLLFEPKVAVSQDFNTLYQICVEGFEELCALDPRFLAFASSIFGEQSKTEEREQMTAEENKELDAVLHSYLSLVGPRLLLKPAQKSVEWLIRRFRIHEHNTEWVILTFLPYHATPLFRSLLSILPHQLPQSFRFLYPSVTALDNPLFHTIMHTATNNETFFSTFNTYVLTVAKARHHSSILLSFWASVVTQAVDGKIASAQSGREAVQKQRQESFLLRVLPVLNEALTLGDVHELVLGCCMIITVLAAKGNLEDHVLDALMEAVATGWATPTIDARITCLSVLAQERTATEISKATVKKLLKFDEFTDHLLLISEKFRVSRLALGFALGCFKKLQRGDGSHVRLDVVEKLLQAEIFTESQLRTIIKALLSTSKKLQANGAAAPEQRSKLSDIVMFLAESPGSANVFKKALDQSAIGQEELELSLQMVIPRGDEPLLLDDNVDARMIDMPLGDSDFDLSLSIISTKELPATSFLSNTASRDFDLYYAVYLLALSSNQRMNSFLNNPNLKYGDSGPGLAQLSFLIRVWTGNYPQVARTKALQILSGTLKKAKRHDVDFQVLIPYLIVACGDSSAIIRRAAAECIVTLDKHYKSAVDNEQQGSASRRLEQIDFYATGETRVERLPFNEAADLVHKILIPDLEECVLDGNNIAIALSTALNGGSHPQSMLKIDSLGLKSSRRGALSAFLASHAVATPVQSVRLQLLQILNRVGKNGSTTRNQMLYPALRQWIVSPPEYVLKVQELSTLQTNVDLEFLRVVYPSEKEGLQLLRGVLAGELSSMRIEVLRPAHQRLKEIWTNLKPVDQVPIALALLNVSLPTSKSQGAAAHHDLAIESLRSLRMPTEALVALIENLPNATNMPDQPSAPKRRRTSKNEMARMAPMDPEDLALALRHYTIVLEIIDSSKPENHPQLLKGLFHALGEIHHYRAQTDSGMIYLQGLTINSLLAIVDKVKDTKEATADKSVIRTDLLVECVRHTTNSQVQNAALLLISCLAAWQPEAVLHNVMPIFTFMGTTILRQGDDYSAHVVDQTVSRVVPPLVASLRKKNKEIVRGASELLLSFTAAFEHIPLNRRLSLFNHVSRTLGPDDCLFAIIAMIVDRYPTDSRARRFIADLINMFEPSNSLQAIRKYLGLVADIFKQRRSLSDVILNLKEKPSDQIDTIANNLLEALAELLDDSLLRSRLVNSFHHDQESANTQRIAFSGLMQEAIRLSQFLKNRPTREPPHIPNRFLASVKLTIQVSQSSSRVLSHIFKVLPTVDLIKCAQTLLEKNDEEVSHVVLRSIDAQVRTLGHLDLDSTAALLEFIPRLISLTQNSKDVMLRHSAISCIDQISERFGKKDTSYIILAAQVIVGEESLQHTDRRLRVASMYCLVTFVDVLREEFIPLLPQTLPQALKYLRSSIAEKESPMRESMAKGSFALINAVAEHLPFLMTGEYLDTALQLAQSSRVSDIGRECANNRAEFYRLIGQDVDAAELFPAFDRNLMNCMLNEGFEALIEYFEAIRFAINNRSKSIIIKKSSALFDLLLKAFDHRRLITQLEPTSHVKYSQEKIDRLEDLYSDVAIAIVMKLNDATFRPFFVRLVEWATALSTKDAKGRSLRATALFKFVGVLFARLKSLVTGYSSYIIELAAELLANADPTASEGKQILGAILTALEESFTHDQDDFWQSPSHFTPIASPLVALLSQFNSPPLTESLITAITALASATSSAEEHKELNTAMLKLMRSDNAATRLNAVQAERKLTEKLGEEWLVMVPEMLPFVAELLEDDDESVERESRAWVRKIEEVLGESLEF